MKFLMAVPSCLAARLYTDLYIPSCLRLDYACGFCAVLFPLLKATGTIQGLFKIEQSKEEGEDKHI